MCNELAHASLERTTKNENTSCRRCTCFLVRLCRPALSLANKGLHQFLQSLYVAAWTHLSRSDIALHSSMFTASRGEECALTSRISLSTFLSSFVARKKILKIFFETDQNFPKKWKMLVVGPRTPPLQNVHLVIHHSPASIGNTTNCWVHRSRPDKGGGDDWSSP